MIQKPNRFSFSRFLLSLFFLATTCFFYMPIQIPRFAQADFLGWYNTVIIFILIAMSTRHFFYLLFSTCEEIRRERLPTDFPTPPISIIVPAFNEAIVIEKTINNLRQLDYPNFEIIIVDDESTDRTYEIALTVSQGDSRIRVLSKENGGKSSALNHGILHSQGDFVFCMDADSLVSSNALRFGIRHFVDPEVVAVAGSVLVLNQKNALTQFQAIEYLTGLNFYKSGQSFLGLVTIIPGPAGLFRKQAVFEVGLYDSDTFAEDCDLTLKLSGQGGKIVYEPYMEVQTEIPEQILPLIKQRYRWNRGILQALRKHLHEHSSNLLAPHKFMVIFYMTIESLFLPVINVFITLGALLYQFVMMDFSLFSFWLFVLVFLDLAVLVVTLVDRRWPFKLIFYMVFNRFTYGLFSDVIRIFATIEETLGLSMSWGKLDRVGGK